MNDAYETIISRTGTRHIVGPRRAAICNFTVRPDEALTEAEVVSDCQFCLDEWAGQQRKAEEEQRKAEEEAIGATGDAA
jgi:hypothetical protein